MFKSLNGNYYQIKFNKYYTLLNNINIKYKL